MDTRRASLLACTLASSLAFAAVNNPYGSCAHVTRGEPPARTCAMMRQAGMGWVRSDFDWRSIEKKKGVWDFAYFDKVVAECEAEGVQLLPILGYSVPWAHPAHAHLDAWEEYVRKVVTHYGKRLPVLEVWNEENHIYYLSIVYDDGAFYPGGQSQYKSEVQTRLIGPGGVWDNSNDFSFLLQRLDKPLLVLWTSPADDEQVFYDTLGFFF